MGIYAIARATAKKEYALIVTHSGPGTLDIPDGTHHYTEPTQIVVIATPDAGYQANWNINGVDVEQGVNQYTLYLTGIVSLSVSFVPVGGGGTVPVGIKPIGSIGTLQNFQFWVGNAYAPVDIVECDENWNPGRCKWQPLLFKVYDASGRGVPNINVSIYPDINPDATPYKTIMNLDGLYGVTPQSPLTRTTDENGIVGVWVLNMYGADDITADGGGKELSRGSNLWIHASCLFGGATHLPTYKGDTAGLSCWWYNSGGGGTISYNRLIRAEIIGTDKSTVQSITVNFGVRWKP